MTAGILETPSGYNHLSMNINILTQCVKWTILWLELLLVNFCFFVCTVRVQYDISTNKKMTGDMFDLFSSVTIQWSYKHILCDFSIFWKFPGFPGKRRHNRQKNGSFWWDLNSNQLIWFNEHLCQISYFKHDLLDPSKILHHPLTLHPFHEITTYYVGWIQGWKVFKLQF